MQTKFTTSTNIIRDSAREIKYLPTPNAKRVVNQIANDFKKGIRSFNIIGSYGTGKSSFLWALQQSLNGRKRFFNINLIQAPKLEIINFIGEFKSITNVFADHFDVTTTKHQTENILSEIFNRYHSLGKKNPLLILVIDEFGKFLEYAAQNSPEKELYFIQQLSEFANNPDHNIILLTAVHQNFDAYAFALTNTQKQEWTKVKGRFREITFNEPVEQLLFLAAEHLQQNSSDKTTAGEIKSALTIAKNSKAFNINAEYANEISSKLFPLDLIAANILTLSLQKYGQNERSLFSFLESTDHTGINSFDKRNNPFYNASCVYDYLTFNFYSYINSRYNPDFAAWSAIKNSLEEVERLFDENLTDYAKILKTIGLLNITAAAGSDLGKDFLVHYSSTCLGIKNPAKLIDTLENRKVILYRTYNKRFVLFAGTDLDISSALIEAGNRVSEISDVATLLNRYYQLPPVLAKSYSYLNGTPRMFEFKISEHPISEAPQEEIDGFINLIFNEKLSLNEIKKQSAAEEEAIIFGFYKNSKTIKNLLFEIEKTRKVIEENNHDQAAVKEL
ncbi:MAG: AAA family ATPase, partial [Bacteroidetes bacterium]|nr:AAA family ATPase [Bacteroidota bacterium]